MLLQMFALGLPGLLFLALLAERVVHAFVLQLQVGDRVLQLGVLLFVLHDLDRRLLVHLHRLKHLSLHHLRFNKHARLATHCLKLSAHLNLFI